MQAEHVCRITAVQQPVQANHSSQAACKLNARLQPLRTRSAPLHVCERQDGAQNVSRPVWCKFNLFSRWIVGQPPLPTAAPATAMAGTTADPALTREGVDGGQKHVEERERGEHDLQAEQEHQLAHEVYRTACMLGVCV